MELTKVLASVFCFLLLLAALILACVLIIEGKPIPNYLATILGTGIGYSLHLLGLDYGVNKIAVAAEKSQEASQQ